MELNNNDKMIPLLGDCFQDTSSSEGRSSRRRNLQIVGISLLLLVIALGEVSAAVILTSNEDRNGTVTGNSTGTGTESEDKNDLIIEPVSPDTAGNGKCFTSKTELSRALRRATSTNSFLRDSTVAEQEYGWPVGTWWCLSKLTDFSNLFQYTSDCSSDKQHFGLGHFIGYTHTLYVFRHFQLSK
jgi:hypothetical protein